MARNAAIEPVSGISITIPLVLLAVLSAAVAVQSGFVATGAPDMSVAPPQTIVIAPHRFAYRDAAEYFRNGLAVDAPRLDMTMASPLEIMKYQTTLRDYDRCVADAICAPAENLGDTSSREVTPVTGVSYDDAIQYAAWLSDHTDTEWRLPTDFELAYAAADRFPDDALGIDPNDRNPANRWLADYEREARRAAAIDPRPQPQGSFGISQTGLVDFAGNVWEWTSTCNKRVELSKKDLSGDPDSRSCGIMIAAGKHRAPMSSFVRIPKGGGCSVGSPPDNLGFRLVRSRGLLERLTERVEGAMTHMFEPAMSPTAEQDDDES
ncbi:nitrate reductase protein (plasmid) [Rhizobium etli CFN 42]|uniref:Nitrate reductase protein n=1 Tax=Rhizobium etli (strain ATCC 51251 / DSM 11541 / JCM 21823 / NBRC 15573 / CFN 42) TaxID=347834 RepID=Q2JYC1_RHIEC|nr:SUMF1/EgtB/PvdO family nonheme iron enzyme [Rhizobium etli]ABC94415.1 nitrate reductase protein [Rhizobium etli CFN 42]